MEAVSAFLPGSTTNEAVDKQKLSVQMKHIIHVAAVDNLGEQVEQNVKQRCIASILPAARYAHGHTSHDWELHFCSINSCEPLECSDKTVSMTMSRVRFLFQFNMSLYTYFNSYFFVLEFFQLYPEVYSFRVIVS